MSRILLLMILAIVNGFNWHVYADTDSVHKCSVPELLFHKHYNDLVCHAVALAESNDYSGAIDALSKASKIHFFESPNFLLYPRLGFLYFKSGNPEIAREYFEKAELSLKIYTKVYTCHETDKGFEVVRISWGSMHRIRSKYAEEVKKVMCGAAYDHIYNPDDFSGVPRQAEIVNNYYDLLEKSK